MKTFRRALLGTLFAMTVVPLTLVGAMPRWYSGPPPPLHPTIIEGNYKGKYLPIVSVFSDSPRVQVDGKLKGVSSSKTVGYAPRRGAAFAPGNLQLRDLKVNASKINMVLMFENGSEVSAGTLSARSDFSATVIPSRDYADCFVALIFFDQGYLEGSTDNPQATVEFHSIKNLVGGQENKIQLTFGYMDFGERRTGYFPLFFTHGVEIRTDHCELIAQFFHRREMALHQAYVKAYCEKHRDKSLPLQPYLQIPPIFPEGTSFEGIPDSVSATFMVSDEGQLENLRFEEKLTPGVAGPLRRTLSGWLFMPRIKEGRAQRTMVTLPINLSQPEAAPSSTPAP